MVSRASRLLDVTSTAVQFNNAVLQQHLKILEFNSNVAIADRPARLVV
jgi:hypothetical protein